MRRIRVVNVSKKYGDEIILDNLSLEIPAGQFFALLGPSGCGKTSLLRLIAGLESVDSGKIYLGDQDITDVPLYERNVNTVFQSYALFPHLSVFQNVAYPLRIKNMPSQQIAARVHETLKMVRLQGHEGRSPRSLSGGQQQRVALARAIISQPDVLLLDEPLAALDLKLKEEMLIELSALQDKLGTTFVYVTHDQFEALTVSDQMAIMNPNGVIEQIGSPKQIYEFPVSRFVATFVGNTNIIPGTMHTLDADQAYMRVAGLGDFAVDVAAEKRARLHKSAMFFSIRPEKVCISKQERSGFSNHLRGKVTDRIYYGRSTQYHVQLENGSMLIVFEQNEEHFPQETIDYDDMVHVYFQKENVVLLEQ